VGGGAAGEGELLVARGELVTEASCREANALFVPLALVSLLLAAAARGLVARRTFGCRFVGACAFGTTRAEGGEENHDGIEGLPP
jgi:hypothetical protein